MTLYRVLLFSHVLMAMVWIGGIVHSEAQFKTIERSRDPEQGIGSYVSLAAVNRKLFLLPSWLVIGLGIWLVVESNRSFSERWIAAALVGSLLAASVGVAWLAAEGIRITKLVRGGSNRDEALIRIFRLSRLRKLHLLVLIAVLALMVWQPS